MQCSFGSISPKSCGAVGEKLQIEPVSKCRDDIQSHLKKFFLQRDFMIRHEEDLLRFRGGFFGKNSQDLTICPLHRLEFGLKWRRSVFCTLHLACGGTKKPRMARTDSSVNFSQSLFLWENDNRLIPVGSGFCVQCRTELIRRMQASKKNEAENGTEVIVSEENDLENKENETENGTEVIVSEENDLENKENETENGTELLESMVLRPRTTISMKVDYTDNSECAEFSQPLSTCSNNSEWQPYMSSSQSSSCTTHFESPTRKRTALNTFLHEVGLSPVKKVLSVEWDSASERTKSDYQRKTHEIMEQIFKIMAPGQEASLAESLFTKDTTRENGILHSISRAYISASSWGVQRQILSLVVNDFSFHDLQKSIPDLTRYKFTAAKRHAEKEGVGVPVSVSLTHREKASKGQLDHFLQFILSPAVMTDSPFGECNYKLSSGTELTAPKIILNTVRTRTVNLYVKFCEETSFTPILSERSYLRILEAIQPSVRKSMKGLDNYAAEGGKAFDDLKQAANILGQIGKDKKWVEDVHKLLNDGKQYLKIQYKLHISRSSEVADHCCSFALSDTTCNSEYSRTCDHNHHQSCLECENVSKAIALINEAAVEVCFEDEDQKDEIQYILQQSTKAVYEWKQHILRTMNQDRARQSVMDSLQPDEALLERDWAMKFLPMEYRESQSKWFAKRGLSWHIGVVSMKEDEYQNITIVHIFDSTSQDATLSACILENTLKYIKDESSQIKKVYVRSDNAGCFHSSYSIATVPIINEKSSVKITRVDFSDPQGGKSICDRKAAHIKGHIRRYVNEGKNVVTANDFKEAVKSMPNVKVIVCSPSPKTSFKSAKIEAINSLNNFYFDEHTITVWKQFDVGAGHTYTYADLGIDARKQLPAMKVLSESTLMKRSKPGTIQTKVNRGKDMDDITSEVSDKSASPSTISCCKQSDDDSGNLFSCPEEGCISTFINHGNLLRHLDIGKHRYAEDNVSLKDRTRMLFTELVDTKSQQGDLMHHVEGSSQTLLQKGWGLKGKREAKRFTADQKAYLEKKFNQGEKTGHKCDPEEVSREMRFVKDESGRRRFKLSEFLAPNQIASYFSRIALKKRQELNTDFQEEDLHAEESTNAIETLRTNILEIES